jgi:hypothetical protein
VFANSESPLEPPLADRPENCASLGDYEKQAGPHREKMQKMVDSQYALLIETARERVGDYLLRVATTEPDHAETAIYFLSLAPTDLRPPMVNKWRRYLARSERAEDPVFGPWYELMRLPEEGFSKAADLTLKTWQKTPRGTAAGGLNPLVAAALSAEKPDSKAAVARTYGALLAATYKEAKGKKATPEQQQLLDVLASKQSPAYFPKSQTWHNMSRGEKDAYGGMKTQFDKIAVKMPAAPPRAMVLFDTTDMIEPKILKRGNPSSPGAIVPRQFLRILSPEKRQPFGPGSGRLDLARAIADTPLTWRVLANRIWMHHFGEPLVSTPSDFGTRSTPPSHPELLDYLAATLKAEGGSLKKLHRDIMLSSTYQQASFDRPNCREIDPDNKLFWRAHRRRLDFEAMRDTLLAVSGQLDRAMYGRPVDVANDPNNRRRTVYGLVDRQSLPGVYRAFDFASPDQSAERRPMTTVPQQALFGLNSPFMTEQAKALAARPEVTGSPSERIAALYRLAIARSPSAAEVQAGLRFVGNGAESSQLNAWQQYAQVLLLTNEVMFVD